MRPLAWESWHCRRRGRSRRRLVSRARASRRIGTVSTPRMAASSASRSTCVTRQSERGRGFPSASGGGGGVQEVLGGIVDQQGQDEVGEQPAAGEGLAL